jgi:predicted DNA-binding protein
MKLATSFRLSKEARKLIAALSLKNGVSQAAIVEMAVRMLAKKESK